MLYFYPIGRLIFWLIVKRPTAIIRPFRNYVLTLIRYVWNVNAEINLSVFSYHRAFIAIRRLATTVVPYKNKSLIILNTCTITVCDEENIFDNEDVTCSEHCVFIHFPYAGHKRDEFEENREVLVHVIIE